MLTRLIARNTLRRNHRRGLRWIGLGAYRRGIIRGRGTRPIGTPPLEFPPTEGTEFEAREEPRQDVDGEGADSDDKFSTEDREDADVFGISDANAAVGATHNETATATSPASSLPAIPRIPIPDSPCTHRSHYAKQLCKR